MGMEIENGVLTEEQKEELNKLNEGKAPNSHLKLCTCCNLIIKRHICEHNKCEKPCKRKNIEEKIKQSYERRKKGTDNK